MSTGRLYACLHVERVLLKDLNMNIVSLFPCV